MTYEEAVNNYLEGKMSINKIVNTYKNISKSTLTKEVKKKLNGKSIREYNAYLLSEKYEKMYIEFSTTDIGMKEICARENASRPNFSKYIEQRALHDEASLAFGSKYSVDPNVFEKIDTEEKAYWLGFLYADGYNSGKYVQVTISKFDFNHLKKFRKFMAATHKIRYRECDNTVNITISNKKIANDLNEKGCVKGKTYSGHFPSTASLPRKLYRHFIRGFFDGDGCISKMILQDITASNSIERKIDKLHFAIKNKHFAEQMANAIEHICNGIKVGIYHMHTFGMNQYEVYIEGQQNVRQLLDVMYKEAHIYLDRKYKKYLMYILPSGLEIDQIINAELSGKVLPDFYPEEEEITRITRTEGVQYELDYFSVIDRRESSQGQSVGAETSESGV